MGHMNPNMDYKPEGAEGAAEYSGHTLLLSFREWPLVPQCNEIEGRRGNLFNVLQYGL